LPLSTNRACELINAIENNCKQINNYLRMKNLLTALQIKDVDHYTTLQQGISSLQLMERASKAFVKCFKEQFINRKTAIAIYCGNGNNGGDGFAISRLLWNQGYKNITVYHVDFSGKQSDDNLKNLKRLNKIDIPLITVTDTNTLADSKASVIIDAILGSGLNKPLAGNFKKLAQFINAQNATIVAVDIPSGFFAEGVVDEAYRGIKADLSITFQLPKINFFFPESVKAQSHFKTVKIGLSKKYINTLTTNWKLVDKGAIVKLIKPRANFTHKGTYGHALIVAGNQNTMGAMLLASNACLNAGVGLVTACIPTSGLTALHTALPEVMCLPRDRQLTDASLQKYTAIAIGPGLGIDAAERDLLLKILKLNKPMVLDADAITILANEPDLLSQLPHQSILTPHLKEFDRLFGEHQSWWERVATARQKAQQFNLIIILKNQYTFICLPNCNVLINPTGNPAMASGGMGDVLTGVVTALLAQHYTAEEAAVLGVYLHGVSGDKLAKKQSFVVAHKVAKRLPKVFKSFKL
jgi:hydroxyethylthiazole kinase-like uncharacterized protein yjeF